MVQEPRVRHLRLMVQNLIHRSLVVAAFALILCQCGGASDPGDTGGNGGAGGEGGAAQSGGGAGKSTGGSGGAMTGNVGGGGSSMQGGSGGSTNSGGSAGGAAGPSGGAAGGSTVAGRTSPAGSTDLLAFIPFDEGTGNYGRDTSGAKNDVILVGTDNGSLWTDGKIGKAAAVGDIFAMIRNSVSLEAIVKNNAVSVSAWIYPTKFDDVTNKPQFIVGRQLGTTANDQFGIGLWNVGKPGFTVGNATLIAAMAVPLNEWTHVAATYDGVTATLFVNGKVVKSDALAVTLSPETNRILIGADSNSVAGEAGERLFGRIDEVALYASALSVADVAKLAAP